MSFGVFELKSSESERVWDSSRSGGATVTCHGVWKVWVLGLGFLVLGLGFWILGGDLEGFSVLSSPCAGDARAHDVRCLQSYLLRLKDKVLGLRFRFLDSRF